MRPTSRRVPSTERTFPVPPQKPPQFKASKYSRGIQDVGGVAEGDGFRVALELPGHRRVHEDVGVEVVRPDGQPMAGQRHEFEQLQRIGHVVQHPARQHEVIAVAMPFRNSTKSPRRNRARCKGEQLLDTKHFRKARLFDSMASTEAPARSNMYVWPPSSGPSSRSAALRRHRPSIRSPRAMRESSNRFAVPDWTFSPSGKRDDHSPEKMSTAC